MVKLWPEFDAFIEDLKNVWEGDALENVLSDDPQFAGSAEDLASKLEEDFRETGDLPSYLDPKIEVEDIAPTVTKMALEVATAAAFGFVDKDEKDWGWWPLSIPLTVGALGALVVISR